MKADASYDAFGNNLDSWNMTFYSFTWAGGYGYRQTGLAYSSVDVRARYSSKLDAGWTTRDPLWPTEMPYGYVEGRVMSAVDYWGMRRAKGISNRVFDCFWADILRRNSPRGTVGGSDYKICFSCATRNGFNSIEAEAMCKRAFPPGKVVFKKEWTDYLNRIMTLPDCVETDCGPAGALVGCCLDITLLMTEVTATLTGFGQFSDNKCLDACEKYMNSLEPGRPPSKLELLNAVYACVNGGAEEPGPLDWLKALLEGVR